MKRQLLLSLTAMVLLGSVGCRHCCRRSRPEPLPPRGGYLESPSRGRGDVLIPPPTGVSPRPEFVPESSVPPPSVSSEPLPSRFRSSRETLYPDPFLEEPAYQKKAPSEPPPVLSLPADLPTSQSSSAKPVTPAGYTERINPSGLPYFSTVTERVSNGRKPNIEGFDTLRNAGVKTLVYLHDANKDVSPTKELAEKKGFKFIGIPSTTSSLKTAFSQFAEAIGDKANRPLFVFDDDGVRTGSLWYLYFRKIESMNDDAAQVKAGPLGLRDATGEEKNRFWQAVHDELGKR